MNLASQIESVFGLPVRCIKIYTEDEAFCMVHKSWLQYLQGGLKIPYELLENMPSDQNLFSYLLTSETKQLYSTWQLVTIFSLKKNSKKVFRFSKPHEESQSVAVHLSYSQLIHYVTMANYKNLWEQAWRKYHMLDNPKRYKQKQDYCDAIREVLKRVFKMQNFVNVRNDGVVVFKKFNESVAISLSSENKGSIHPNLLEVLCAVESDETFLLVCNKQTCTLMDCLMFSPFVLNGSTIRPLFVIYQLLQALRSVHNQGLFMGPLTLSNIGINENLWIQTIPLTWKTLSCKTNKFFENRVSKQMLDEVNAIHRSTFNFQEGKSSSNILRSYPQKETVENNYINLSSLVCGWVDGSISNYDYLIALNKLVGRIKDNPHCHYVMPWIMDFSVPEGGWRDLTKSKFRLNKGDKQLDLIYESSMYTVNTNTSHSSSNILQASAVTVPHHMSEVLSDITYYVYKARRMPKSFLCQYVRQKWVPAEYPSTIERLQEWTPDECIPEFFSEPEIFCSIHPDLCDLGVPWWCDGPEDFVKKHREALEGYYVSERLHHWIDLVFGYKMTGLPALKSKNICLPLVDHHTTIHSYGMVQLFHHPHPHKLSRSIFSGILAPKTYRSVTVKISEAKDSCDDDTSSESLSKPSFLRGLRSKPSTSQDSFRWEARPETQTIVLPKDFNPLASLTHFESLFSFVSWAGGGKIDKTTPDFSEVNDILAHHFQIQDLCVLGCLISEIAVFNKCKTLPLSASLEERYSNCVKLLSMHKQEIPRYPVKKLPIIYHSVERNSVHFKRLNKSYPSSKAARVHNQKIGDYEFAVIVAHEEGSLQCVIQLLLQLTPFYHKQYDNIGYYPPISNCGLPLPSPHQLLIPSIPVIPFPSYFPVLYSFLYELNNYSREIYILSEESESAEGISKIECIAERKVSFVANQLMNILPTLNSEAIELLIPYIKEMFQNNHTSLLATWYLFGMVAEALGPQQTCTHLLTHLTKLFDNDRPSPKYLKLYHRAFLLQLIVRLGLHNFLIHFTTILIEAIGGCKDYSLLNSKSEINCLESSFSSNLHKLDHMPENFDYCSTEDISYEVIALKMKALSQDGLHLQTEMSNEEDTELFDLEVNEEVLKDNAVIKELPTCFQDEYKDECEHENEISPDFTSMSNYDNAEIYDNNTLNTDPWNLINDSTYSKSAPASTCLTEWYINVGNEADKTEGTDQPFKSQTGSYFDEIAFNPCHSDQDQTYNVSDVSAESMLWLAHRLGPVLTARYLTRNLLRMLTLCYDGAEKREIIYIPSGKRENILSISCKWFKGDINAFKVLDCLSRIASLYGEQFIILQYIKHIADLLNLCKKRITTSLESGLHGAMALLHHIIPYISDSTLMDHLQDTIIKDILYLVLRLISSLQIVYPSGEISRLMITLRLLDVIYTIGLRIGFEMTRKHFSIVLQKFFSCFDKVYNERCEYKALDDILVSPTVGSFSLHPGSSIPLKEEALKEMRQTFTPEVAFMTYIPFCKLAGGIHMEKMLKNDELIRNLCMIHDKNMQISSCQKPLNNGNASEITQMTHHQDHSFGQDDLFVTGIFGKNVNVIGNRLDVHLGDESHLVMGTGEPVSAINANDPSKIPIDPKYDITLIKRKMDNCTRHLKGNWLAYWEHETGRSEKDNHFDFKQIKLQTFVGHSGTVRTIEVLDNENSFVTSSKDKTVKLWSLRSYGDGTAQIPCQWTYTQHRKSVFAVSFLDSLRLIGSCDSTVHIWDPFLGSCIKQLEPTKGSPITVLTAMPAPSSIFLAATTNSTIKFLDARTCRYMHEFKVSVGTTGLIRCLAVNPSGNWLAVGHSTGMLSVLDVRTGLLIGTWLGHEGEILQLKAFNNMFFISSSLDHGLTVWRFEDTQAKCYLKGPMEPVTSLCFYGNEVISGTSGNRIGLHSSIDKRATYTSTRLRSDTFKGMLTTMALLPLNRLLLLGTDNGSVVLLS